MTAPATTTTRVSYLGGPRDGGMERHVHAVGILPPIDVPGYTPAAAWTGAAVYQWSYPHTGRRTPGACAKRCSRGCPVRTT